MKMAAYIDLNGLRSFKFKQDEYNLGKFASLSGGKISSNECGFFICPSFTAVPKN